MEEVKVVPLEEKYITDCLNIENSLLSPTSYDKILSTISDDFVHYYVLIKNDKVIGFFECKIISPEAELYDIAIVKSEQGKGYSKILMNYFISLCKDLKCDTIFLEVNSMNYKAIDLYEKYGFTSYMIRKNYYGDNDAILMKLSI